LSIYTDGSDVSDQPSRESKTEFIGDNLGYFEELYEQYRQDPDSVDPSWRPFFEEYLEGEKANGQHPRFRRRSIFEGPAGQTSAPAAAGPVPTGEITGSTIVPVDRAEGFAARVEALVRSYRLHGHLVANIDPLGRRRPKTPAEWDPERYGEREPDLDPSEYGLTDEDLDAEVRAEGLFPSDRKVTVRQVIDRLESLYCQHIGVEYQSIPVSRPRNWLREQIETNDYASIGGEEEQKRILKRLIEAESFESFIHQKYIGAKRFGLTGGDSLIPMLDAVLDELGSRGVDEAVFAMAHRGRLNVLHNIMGKPADQMLSEFEEDPEPEDTLGSSDVKYHMGYSADYTSINGHDLHLSLCFNPSHLEFVNPVALGRTRAKQDRRGEDAKSKIAPILMHGDAAFAGQGIVAESLNLARLSGFDVGGSIHIVINNQIGFTTEPEAGRSTTYATDIAQMLEVPIFHVNVNDPEACVRVAKLAARYRQLFGEDVIIDLVCYREYGHNEGDEPRFTQPTMYDAIDSLDHVYEIYGDKLAEQGVIDEDFVDSHWDRRMDAYGEVFEDIHETPKPSEIDSGSGLWSDFTGGSVDGHMDVDTTVDRDRLVELAEVLADVPDDFTPHRTLRRFMKNRQAMAEGEEPLNWPMGEALATASLLEEGTSVRISGQDAIRGTFSHRHAALFDNETGEAYWPARSLAEDGATYEVYNSMLSEAGVLGFEHGFSLDSPDKLVAWEAQFGDFSNGAQVIIDQFISASEDKWDRLSGLVMLLPHAYEGQGPEHSSARLERYLQLCAEDNMFVMYLTNPAQYFHALRRQVLTDVRKPMIIMTPKSLLRHKDAKSSLDDLADGGFEPVIGETRDTVDPDGVERVLLCAGKVYYDLLDYAREHDRDDVAILRLEQLYPLERERLVSAVEPYGDAELTWVQEEPRNMGAWTYLLEPFIEMFGAEDRPEFVGRVPSASPATGSKASHKLEQKRLVERAFDLG
jgi:2-oxoglutarate dehydrogenase E1 component